jgi:hypothetical protein
MLPSNSLSTPPKVIEHKTSQYSFQDLSGRMIYSLDDRGQFLVISSMNSHYLYVLELITTHGHLAPDAFSRMFCYPMKSGLFDLSISDVVEEENILGRYEVKLNHEFSLMNITFVVCALKYKSLDGEIFYSCITRCTCLPIMKKTRNILLGPLSILL